MKSLIQVIEGLNNKAPMEVGMDGIYSKMPTEKLSMPVKSAAEAFKLAADGEEEFCEIMQELLNSVKGNGTVSGRIKTSESLERKCKLYGIEPADLDDVSGKMIIVKSLDDLYAVAKMMKDDDRVVRIFDYATHMEDAGYYYAIHGNYKLKNGLIAEVQVITRRLQAYKSIYGHIMYEVFRELLAKVRRKKNPEIQSVMDKIDNVLTESYKNCYKADKNDTKCPAPDLSVFDDNDIEIVRANATEKTADRFEMLLECKAKSNNTKIDDATKKLIENKND